MGSDILIHKVITINYVHHKKYIINSEVLNEHINLSNL
jgi:hypothetical protein